MALIFNDGYLLIFDVQTTMQNFPYEKMHVHM